MDLLTVAQVAKYLKVTKNRVYQMIESGKLESLRLSARGIRIRRTVVEQYLASKTAEQKRELGLDLPRAEVRHRRISA
jgi:excisionase family DNA binding protein